MCGLENKITELEAQLYYVLSDNGRSREGHTVFTIVSGRTGTRFTYRIKRAVKHNDYTNKWELQDRWFVSILNGEDNESDYQYAGTIVTNPDGTQKYIVGRRSRVSESAPSQVAFSWYFDKLVANDTEAVAKVEFWHSGRCGRCGRELTVPGSIANGLGPECIKCIKKVGE